MAAALSNSFALTKQSPVLLSSGCSSLRSVESIGCFGSSNVSLRSIQIGNTSNTTSKRTLTIQAEYSDGRSSGSSGIFVGAFVLGGIIVGALGCIYAPQISKAIVGADKGIMKKLPKIFYDEEKALERTRKVLADKIAQLNDAIDDVSAQLRTDDAPNGAVAIDGEELEVGI